MTVKPTILISDDDKTLVEVLANHCLSLGLNVVTAYSGIATMRAVLERKPNLICIDVNLPAGDGLTVCEVLANDAEIRQIPTIVLTTRHDAVTKRCTSILPACYFRKRHDIWPSLKAVIEELVDVSSESAELKNSRGGIRS